MFTSFTKEISTFLDKAEKESSRFRENSEKTGYELIVLKGMNINPDCLDISYNTPSIAWAFTANTEKMLIITYDNTKLCEAVPVCYKLMLNLPSDADPDTMDANIVEEGLLVTVEKKKDSK